MGAEEEVSSPLTFSYRLMNGAHRIAVVAGRFQFVVPYRLDVETIRKQLCVPSPGWHHRGGSVREQARGIASPDCHHSIISRIVLNE